jgi:hypothetical protein
MNSANRSRICLDDVLDARGTAVSNRRVNLYETIFLVCRDVSIGEAHLRLTAGQDSVRHRQGAAANAHIMTPRGRSPTVQTQRTKRKAPFRFFSLLHTSNQPITSPIIAVGHRLSLAVPQHIPYGYTVLLSKSPVSKCLGVPALAHGL